MTSLLQLQVCEYEIWRLRVQKFITLKFRFHLLKLEKLPKSFRVSAAAALDFVIM